MRRDTRRRTENQNWWEDKKVLLGGSAIALVLVIVGVVSMYSGNTGKSTAKNDINPSQIISLAPEDEIEENTESASSSIGNKVNENQTANTNTNNSANATTTNNTTNSAKETAEKISQNKTNTQNEVNKASSIAEDETKATSTKAESNEKVTFDWPVKGDILKAFSVDNLLYSSTLQEWTVHNGIDIKADKASVVCAAADGTVKSIKNDPRYGLTIIIEHSNGYKTVYSNLLTTEFVVEGEKVSKEQSIGTVGNTANFEVADDFHLHFEVLKDDAYVDPMIYLK